MANELSGFVHRFVPAEGSEAPTLLLLHGTGGDENDLISVVACSTSGPRS